MKTYWPMAERKEGEPLTTYGPYATLVDSMKQFEIWANGYGFDMKEMWVTEMEDMNQARKINVTCAFKAAETKPEYKDVARMYEKGIILSSGTVLSSDDVYEISRLLDVKGGMESFDYAAESLRDEGEEVEVPEDLQFYKEIQEEKTGYVTGSDEIDIVKDLLKRRRQK